MDSKIRQVGAVSIFVVIFSALLLTVLTVSFIQIMTSEQRRATNSDLSQSAYDASLAGVEDAKRVLRACATEGASSNSCQALASNAGDCKVIARAGIAGNVTLNETVIQSSVDAGSEFNQAYTCVNINMQTPDFIYESIEGRSQLVPLKSAADFDTVVVEWFMQKDLGAGSIPTAPTGSSDLFAKGSSNWGISTPPLMRTQLITPGASFDVNSLNDTKSSQTVFLRPSSMANGSTNLDIAELSSRPRATTPDGEFSNDVSSLPCSRDFANGGYSCKVSLRVGRTVSQAESQNAYLRLTSVYRGANVRVSLFSGGSLVNFNGVQPSVDSTGRAADLFRRVEARLQVGDDFPYPNYAVDVTDDICKDFSVDNARAYPGSCTP